MDVPGRCRDFVFQRFPALSDRSVHHRALYQETGVLAQARSLLLRTVMFHTNFSFNRSRNSDVPGIFG